MMVVTKVRVLVEVGYVLARWSISGPKRVSIGEVRGNPLSALEETTRDA